MSTAKAQGAPDLKVLVVDDRALYRKILRDVVDGFAGLRTVGTANNGEQAIFETGRLKPDVILLDVEMPVLDGLRALPRIKKAHAAATVVMVSSPSRSAADSTMQALQEGASHFIEKPAGMSPSDSRRRLVEALRSVVVLARTEQAHRMEAEAAAAAKRAEAAPNKPVLEIIPAPAKSREVKPAPRPARPTRSPPAKPPRPAAEARPKRAPLAVARPAREFTSLRKDVPARFSVLAIGVSTGGPAALGKLIPELPKTLKVPVVIVQHMPAGFTQSLAAQLDAKSPLDVREAAAGDLVLPGEVLIAPGGQHMEVVRESGLLKVRLHDGEPVKNCRPSVNVLFESLTTTMDQPVLSLILTGMGEDGADGVEALSRRGSYNLAQDAATAVVYGMPRAVAERGLTHEVLPLARIAARIRELTRTTGSNA